ncbi:MAG TPA: nucleotide disphospho-sugar-binding domain-containing protein [Candidatus Aquilonibacter sp.]|nr:nucleotide disphospho-sugar-binding domain-containing protein [Candidatus Aquilonibacter sp.]
MLRAMRIGVVIPAAVGHLNAMTALARRLQTRGHDVVCFGVPDAAKGVAAAGLPFESFCEQQFPLGYMAVMSEKLSKLAGDEAVAFTFQWIGDTCRAELDETPGLLERIKVDGLVLDRIAGGVCCVAIAKGVPYVHISCTPLIDYSGVTPPWMFPWPHEDSEAARERNRQGVAGFRKAVAPMTDVMLRYVMASGVAVDAEDPAWSESKLAHITQLPAALDFPANHLPAHRHNAGPFHDGKGREDVEFPWEQMTGAPVIYASMGTLQTGLTDVFRAILRATEREGYQVVLSVGPTTEPKSLATARADTIVVQRAPQLELLKRAALCVTHAGMNTTLEALAQGVPLVAIPVTNDQPGVAARILASGAGLFVPLKELTAETLKAMVDEVLEDKRFRERAEALQREIALLDGLGMAAELIEKALAGRKQN